MSSAGNATATYLIQNMSSSSIKNGHDLEKSEQFQ